MKLASRARLPAGKPATSPICGVLFILAGPHPLKAAQERRMAAGAAVPEEAARDFAA